ncbi:hypothetical protein BKA65DRAFT_56599 [Rhexocercosporidium sp. MPI-PUGE-AT-0058]|nr:hypothetical protein BKA65DRAFT_56599 [Rhexocercosporidium sp. MPI-PUGE-AT-0058]
MTFPENNEAEAHAQFERFKDWTCPICFKKISASRPPIFNADNCSCDEVANYHIGNNGYYSEPATYEHPLYNPDVAAPVYNQARSVASSSASIPCPEGPEHENPNLPIGNAYLPLAAAPGLNETEHQRAASFHSEMSYPLQRYLGELRTHPGLYETELVDRTSNSNSKFLSQEIHLQSSKKVKKGSPHSKLSWMSGSSGSTDASVSSWGMDALTGAGGWANSSGYGNTEAYAMALSGMSDCAVFDDDDDDDDKMNS